MPVYLFTYHTYGSWMPDRPQGYVRRGEGLRPQDFEMAGAYRRRMKQDTVLLADEQQKTTIESLLMTAEHINATVYAVATELTHLHVLVSWHDDRDHERVSTSLKRGMTITLKKTHGEQKWLSRDHSRKHVEDREHFDHLLANYLPKHSGWKWSESRGYFKTGDG